MHLDKFTNAKSLEDLFILIRLVLKIRRERLFKELELKRKFSRKKSDFLKRIFELCYEDL